MLMFSEVVFHEVWNMNEIKCSNYLMEDFLKTQPFQDLNSLMS